MMVWLKDIIHKIGVIKWFFTHRPFSVMISGAPMSLSVHLSSLSFVFSTFVAHTWSVLVWQHEARHKSLSIIFAFTIPKFLPKSTILSANACVASVPMRPDVGVGKHIGLTQTCKLCLTSALYIQGEPKKRNLVDKAITSLESIRKKGKGWCVSENSANMLHDRHQTFQN